MIRNDDLVPVVGIGASAGGLEAMVQLIEAVDVDLGLAYLVVSHMDPRHESHLAEILSKHTSLPVEVATDRAIERNHIYVIPPNSAMTLNGNNLRLHARGPAKKQLPIDILFDSIAEHRAGTAIGVVLSGTGSDGAEGIKKIKEAAGVTLVQAPDSAAFPGMPNAAIESGCVDLVLRPADIGLELGKIARHPYLIKLATADDPQELAPDAALQKIFALISSVYQADFTQYKPNTIQRRLQRRMALINETDVQSYLTVIVDPASETMV